MVGGRGRAFWPVRIVGETAVVAIARRSGRYEGELYGVGCLFAYDLINQSDCCGEREERLVDGWWLGVVTRLD